MTTTITPISYNNNTETLDGIQDGDIFKVLITLNKIDANQFAMSSEMVKIFRKNYEIAQFTFNTNGGIDIKKPDTKTDGGGENTYLNDNEVYELPKSKKRKTKQIYNKTLSRKNVY
jgi:hypothetical protein